MNEEYVAINALDRETTSSIEMIFSSNHFQLKVRIGHFQDVSVFASSFFLTSNEDPVIPSGNLLLKCHMFVHTWLHVQEWPTTLIADTRIWLLHVALQVLTFQSPNLNSEEQ